MEQKIDGIVALLSTQPSDSRLSTSRQDATSVPGPGEQQPPQSAEYLGVVRPSRCIHLGADDQAFTESWPDDRDAHSFPQQPDIRDPSSGLHQGPWDALIDHAQADVFLKHFRSMSEWFPFVIVPNTQSASYLSTERPVLLLAIMTVASGESRQLQLALEALLRQEIATRCLVQRKKNLELVQSILVYLAW